MQQKQKIFLGAVVAFFGLGLTLLAATVSFESTQLQSSVVEQAVESERPARVARQQIARPRIDRGVATQIQQTVLQIESGSVMINGMPATDGAVLREGDELKIGESATASILFFDDSVSRLAPGTSLVIADLDGAAGADESHVLLRLEIGNIWSKVTKLINQDSTFAVETNDVVAAVRGSAFDVSVDETGQMEVVAVEHTIALTDAETGKSVAEVIEGSQASAQTEQSDDEAELEIEVAAISADFRQAAWYVENAEKDEKHEEQVAEKIKSKRLEIAGALPGSADYSQKIEKDATRLMQATTDLAQIQVLVEVAERKLIEAQALLDLSQTDLAQKSLDEVGEIMLAAAKLRDGLSANSADRIAAKKSIQSTLLSAQKMLVLSLPGDQQYTVKDFVRQLEVDLADSEQEKIALEKSQIQKKAVEVHDAVKKNGGVSSAAISAVAEKVSAKAEEISEKTGDQSVSENIYLKSAQKKLGIEKIEKKEVEEKIDIKTEENTELKKAASAKPKDKEPATANILPDQPEVKNTPVAMKKDEPKKEIAVKQVQVQENLKKNQNQDEEIKESQSAKESSSKSSSSSSSSGEFSPSYSPIAPKDTTPPEIGISILPTSKVAESRKYRFSLYESGLNFAYLIVDAAAVPADFDNQTEDLQQNFCLTRDAYLEPKNDVLMHELVFQEESDNGKLICLKAKDSAANQTVKTVKIAGIQKNTAKASAQSTQEDEADTESPVIEIDPVNDDEIVAALTITAKISNDEPNLDFFRFRPVLKDQSCEVSAGTWSSSRGGDFHIQDYPPNGILVDSEQFNGFKICFAARDIAQNLTIAEVKIPKIDATGPQISLEVQDLDSKNSKKIVSTITDENDQSPKIWYKIFSAKDFSENTCSAENQNIAFSPDGSLNNFVVKNPESDLIADSEDQRFCFVARDAFGNISYKSINGVHGLDTTGPEFSVVESGNETAKSKTFQVGSSAEDIQSIFWKEVSVQTSDCSDGIDFSEAKIVPGTNLIFDSESDNQKKICFAATDKAGNWTRKSEVFEVSGIDLTAPEIVIDFSESEISATSASPDLDSKSWKYCFGRDDTDPSKCESYSGVPKGYAKKLATSHEADVITFCASDRLGNRGCVSESIPD